MIATNAGQDAVAACLLARRARDERTVKPCGPDSPTLESSFAEMIGKATGANKPGTPGRSRSSRNTIAQGMPARAGLPIFLVRVSVFLRTSLRVHRAPGIPCALHLFEGQGFSQSSGKSKSRECGATPSDVMPRDGGASSIPEASRLSTAVSGILDRPIKSGDDTEYDV